MKLGDKLSIGAFVVSIFALLVSSYLAVFMLFSQQNFDLKVSEVEELKTLRSEIISIVEKESVCMFEGDLTDLSGGNCNKSPKTIDPLSTSSRIRLLIYKKAYLFDQKFLQEALNLTGANEPFSPDSKSSYELDGDEYITFVHSTIKNIDGEINKNRSELNWRLFN